MIRILIADDHAIVRRGLKEILLDEYPSATIGEAPDSEQLIAKTFREKWDVVICDLNMPGRSGFDALRQIKELNPKLPVLIMSVYAEDQYAVRALRAGASGYFSKDSIHDQLIHAIETVRTGKRFITPAVADKLVEAVNARASEYPHHGNSRD